MNDPVRERKLLNDLIECYDIDRYTDFVANLPGIVEEARAVVAPPAPGEGDCVTIGSDDTCIIHSRNIHECIIKAGKPTPSPDNAKLVAQAAEEGLFEVADKLKEQSDALEALRKECEGLKTEIDYWEEKESEAQARIAELEGITFQQSQQLNTLQVALNTMETDRDMWRANAGG